MSDGTDFVSKCKSAIKLTLDHTHTAITNKNEAQNSLRGEVADLIENGSKADAYSKAEEYLAEENIFQIYECIYKFCDVILTYLSDMGIQSDCPENCRQAASSLMFAATRFTDFPELHELRTVLFERYGTSLDEHVDKKFAEDFMLPTPSNDMKLKLLNEIATQHDLDMSRITTKRNLKMITLADTPASSKKCKLKIVRDPQTPKEHFTMLHRVCERARSVTKKTDAVAAQIEERDRILSKIMQLDLMFVKTDSELDLVAKLGFKGSLYIGCNVSTDAVQRYKDTRDQDQDDNRIVHENVVLRRSFRTN